MSNPSPPLVTLSNGVTMPALGFGVFKVPNGEDTIQAVNHALKAGYRSIDTAAFYGNEEGVRIGLEQSGVPREEVFITTKVWNSEQGYDRALASFENSRRLLGVDIIDLYLIHWPVKGRFTDTWRALEKLYKDGNVRSIGVSNFHAHHLETLKKASTVTPMINQVELHPRLSQKPLRKYCREQNILVEAWSPLMRGRVLDDPVITGIAENHGKTSAQVVLRWEFQHDIITIPKSVTPSRIEENLDIFDFQLSDEETASIDGLNRDERIGPDPDNFNF